MMDRATDEATDPILTELRAFRREVRTLLLALVKGQRKAARRCAEERTRPPPEARHRTVDRASLGDRGANAGFDNLLEGEGNNHLALSRGSASAIVPVALVALALARRNITPPSAG